MYFTKEKIKEIHHDIDELESRYRKDRKEEDKKDPRQRAEECMTKTLKYRYASNVGGRLKELREARNVTQEEMTEIFYPLAPTTVSGYSRIESGDREPSIALLVMIADVWDEDLHWLLTGENKERPLLPVDVRTAMSVIADYCQNVKRP